MDDATSPYLCYGRGNEAPACAKRNRAWSPDFAIGLAGYWNFSFAIPMIDPHIRCN
jgi:hypothetical protein